MHALSLRREIRRGAIAVWGLSEGAFICPRVAAGNPEVAAIVVVGAAAIAPVRQQDWAVRNGLLAGGAGELATRPVTTAYRMFAAADPDFRSDPRPWWRRAAQPVLAVWGAEDRLVPIRESARALRAQLQAGPNTDVTFRSFARAGHGLAVGARGGEVVYAPGFLALTARWLRERLSARTRRRVDDAPLPAANGVTVTHAVEPPAWHGGPAAQIIWAALVLAAALLAPALRSGVPARTVVALDVLALAALPAGLALILADDGQGILVLGGYPLALWPAVALTAASVALTARLIVTQAAGPAGPRRHGALAALAAASLLLSALVVYWLL